MNTYSKLADIEEVVRRFESCEYWPEEFTHARHLTVACFYLSTLPTDQALSRMRTGLHRFIEHHGKQGYHETITRFWMKACGQFLSGQAAGTDLVENINATLQALANKELLFRHYSRDLVMSEAARQNWIEPDLHAIPAGQL